MPAITSMDQLRALYKNPTDRAVLKDLKQLDDHCRNYIALSRFVLVSSRSSGGHMDVSPRGGEPGFVKVVDDSTIIIPDWPGNNRLDTFSNIIETGAVGLIFLIAGVDETLRINGTAQLRTDDELLEWCPEKDKLPKLVIAVTVRQAFLHCAKALMRSRLWDADAQVERSALPTMGEMLKDQLGSKEPAETREHMLERYKNSLY